MKHIAFISGIAGQDGSYLAELLIEKGYKVYGLARRSSHMSNFDRLKSIKGHPDLHVVYGDVTDVSSIMSILCKTRDDPERDLTAPIEIYNLAAQSHVKISFDIPIYTANTDAIGALNILEAVKSLDLVGSTRIYQASTSELYGSTPPPQSESTPMCPQSPYAISKLFAFWMVKNYRDAYGMYVVNGILFNHESERRPENFVSRKITSYVARYHKGLVDQPLELGNLYAKRDWGYAKDFVQAMWAILQKDTPQDYVIATGKQYTVKEFVDIAFKCINVILTWKGDEAWDGEQRVVVVNPAYFRPTEVESLCGNPDLARKELGWTPKTSIEELVRIMVHYDIQNLLKVTR